MIQQAVDAEPDNMAYRDSLGWVFFRLGNTREAVAELEKAAADKKPDGGSSIISATPTEAPPPRQGGRGMAQGGRVVPAGKRTKKAESG